MQGVCKIDQVNYQRWLELLKKTHTVIIKANHPPAYKAVSVNVKELAETKWS